MKFRPRLPRDDINVSETHPLREAATLVFGILAVLILAVLAIGETIDFAVASIPVDTEQKLFGSLAESLAGLESGDHIENDSPQLAHLDQLVARLSSHWPDNPYQLRIAMLDDPKLNAVAFPGGLILVTQGLLDTVESENELAFVIAHEIGHFRHRHHLSSVGRRVSIAILLATLGLGESGPALTTAAGDLAALQFDREDERQADAFALELVATEYGHISQAWRFFERIAGDALIDSMAEYVSTHPAPETRIESLYSMAAQRGWRLEGDLHQLPELPLEAGLHEPSTP